MTNKWKSALLGACVLGGALFAGVPANPAGKKLPHGEWDVWMLGADTPEWLALFRQDVKRPVRLALVTHNGLDDARLRGLLNRGKSSIVYFGGNSKSCRNPHDNNQIYEVLLPANRLGLKLEIQVYQSGKDGNIAPLFEQAAKTADLVITYHSFWGAGVAEIAQSIRNHPHTPFLAPYGEIRNCPPTSESLQAHARKHGKSSLPNLASCVPLSPGSKGRLLRPSCRTREDTECITFVTPSSYARGPGSTCPAVGMTAIAAAWIIATSDRVPEAETLLRLMTDHVSIPEQRMLTLAEFDQAAVKQLRNDLKRLTTPDKFGIQRLSAPGIIDLQEVRKALKKP